MCEVLSKHFTKNNSVEWGSCSILQTDALRAEAIVSFQIPEVYKTYWANFWIRQPNGQDMAPYSAYIYANSATMTFNMDNPITNLQIGTYTLLRVEIREKATGALCGSG